MQSFNLKNVVKSLKNYQNINVIIKKIYINLFGIKNNKDFSKYLNYLKENALDYDNFFSKIDLELWNEAK